MDKRRVNKLVREIARGNTAAAEELYALMKRPLMSFAAPSLRDFPEAEDVVQSVFLKIIQKSREMTYFTDAFAWIFKIARNECNDRLRARSRETHADGGVLADAGRELADGRAHRGLHRRRRGGFPRACPAHAPQGGRERTKRRKLCACKKGRRARRERRRG